MISATEMLASHYSDLKAAQAKLKVWERSNPSRAKRFRETKIRIIQRRIEQARKIVAG